MILLVLEVFDVKRSTTDRIVKDFVLLKKQTLRKINREQNAGILFDFISHFNVTFCSLLRRCFSGRSIWLWIDCFYSKKPLKWKLPKGDSGAG